MDKKLRRIAPLQMGKVAGLTYALLSLVAIPFLIIGILITVFTPNSSTTVSIGGAIVLMILLPFIYGVLGFIFGVIGAWVYNIVAGWTGGIAFEVE
jgi:hypothetical protein